VWGQGPKGKLSRFMGYCVCEECFCSGSLELFGGSNQWNVSTVRLAHDWEVDVFALLFNLLYLVTVRQEGEDKF
jgi:hypothetical protein